MFTEEDIQDDLEETLPTPSKIPITSFSRLGVFHTCSEFYKLKYREKSIRDKITTEALVLGRINHFILEECLDPNTLTSDPVHAFTLALPEFLHENELSGLSEMQEEIIDYCSKGAHLLYRASERCRNEDYPIRNKDRTVPKNPLEYPPMDFSSSFKSSGCADFKLELDTAAGRTNHLFTSSSLFWLISKTIFWTKYWRQPSWVKQTLAVELEFSTNPDNKVPFSDVFMNGYIDWVLKTKDDLVGIIDHKTSKAKPTPQGVLHHPQLNLYAWMYHYIYGKWPDFIGINHLPSGEIIQVALDIDISLSIVKYLKELHEATTSGVYVRKHPTDYNSPCIKRDWKSNEITYMCPALTQCWPTYVDTLSLLC